MSERPTFYINKPSWVNHPFEKSKSMGVKDYDWEDTFNFIKLIQDTSQTRIHITKVDTNQTPLPLRGVVECEVHGCPLDGSTPKLLGWLTTKPRSWNYALGMVRRHT